jgi:hypothetical protein
MRSLTTAQIIEVGKALLPYLRADLSSEELGQAAHDAASAFFRAKFGDAGLSTMQRVAISCGNDPYADEAVCPQCKGRGHVSVDLENLQSN